MTIVDIKLRVKNETNKGQGGAQLRPGRVQGEPQTGQTTGERPPKCLRRANNSRTGAHEGIETEVQKAAKERGYGW